MGFVELVELNGVQIKTTVTNRKKKVDDHLRSFLRSAESGGNKMKVIGFDTEWQLQLQELESEDYYCKSQCATMHLCDGDSCLIIQLQHLDSMPISLFNFLRLPDFTFVGVGIKENMAKLEREYGIGCKNAVELGPLAASVKEMPRLSACGVDELYLALDVNDIKLHNHRPISVVFKDWGADQLSKEHAKLATINVYAYNKIGNKLLGGN